MSDFTGTGGQSAPRGSLAKEFPPTSFEIRQGGLASSPQGEVGGFERVRASGLVGWPVCEQRSDAGLGGPRGPADNGGIGQEDLSQIGGEAVSEGRVEDRFVVSEPLAQARPCIARVLWQE